MWRGVCVRVCVRAKPCMVCHLDSTKSAWNSPIVLCWSLISIVKISNCVRHETHTNARAHTQPLPPAVSCQFLLSVQHTHTLINTRTHKHTHINCSFSWHADERRLRLLAACHQSATHEHQSDVIGLTDRPLFITLTVNPAVCSEMLVKCLQKVAFLPSVSVSLISYLPFLIACFYSSALSICLLPCFSSFSLSSGIIAKHFNWS